MWKFNAHHHARGVVLRHLTDFARMSPKMFCRLSKAVQLVCRHLHDIAIIAGGKPSEGRSRSSCLILCGALLAALAIMQLSRCPALLWLFASDSRSSRLRPAGLRHAIVGTPVVADHVAHALRVAGQLGRGIVVPQLQLHSRGVGCAPPTQCIFDS